MNGTITNLTLGGGTLKGSQDLSNTFTWSNGAISDAGTTHLLAGATATFGNNADHQSQLGHTFTNDSTITVTSGQIRLCDGSVLQNNGTLILSSAAATFNGCGGVVNNPATGIITKTAASGGVTVFSTLNNAGTVNVNAGSVGLQAGTESGTYNLAAATTLTVPNSRTFSAGSAINQNANQHRGRRRGDYRLRSAQQLHEPHHHRRDHHRQRHHHESDVVSGRLEGQSRRHQHVHVVEQRSDLQRRDHPSPLRHDHDLLGCRRPPNPARAHHHQRRHDHAQRREHPSLRWITAANTGTITINSVTGTLDNCVNSGTVDNQTTGVITKTAASTGLSIVTTTLTNAGAVIVNGGSSSQKPDEPVGNDADGWELFGSDNAPRCGQRREHVGRGGRAVVGDRILPVASREHGCLGHAVVDHRVPEA